MAEHHSGFGAAVSPSGRALVAAEQLRMLLENSRVATVAASVFAVLLAIYLHGSASPELVRGWILAKLAVAAARLGLAQWHVRDMRRGPAVAAPWPMVTYGLLALDGAVWGVAGCWMMFEAVPVASLVGAALACVTCVATFGLQIQWLATAAYCAPILVPTAIGLMLRGDDMGLLAGPGLLLLLAQQLYISRNGEQRFAAGILLRLEAQALAAEKESALQLAHRQSAVKTQFLAKLSHELRTPLHGILGLARLLHLEAREPVVSRRIELIEASGTHLLGLINDLLDVSRVESDRFTLRDAPFDPVVQGERLAELFALRAADKGLVFGFGHTLERPSWVMGDAARFRQVLHNLLGNAIKFTRRGGVELRLTQGALPEMLQVEVSDTGIGISAAEQRRVFEAFRQADQASDEPTAGAGLGLTIAREIAQAMGGDITLASEPGVGSRFVFTARLPPAAADSMVAGDAASSAAPAVGALRLVLVAEDDDVNALIIEANLEQLGLASERVSDGHQAVGHALRETERPDLVLMDCRMPLLDGLAATREIRQQERTLGLPRVPIIALTATNSAEDRQQCFDAGMDDFVSKPYTRDELTRALERWSGQPRAQAAVAG